MALRLVAGRRAAGAFIKTVATLAAIGIPALAGGPLRAFEFSSLDVFGLFTSKDETPAANPQSLPYAVTFDVTGADDVKAVTSALQEASNLYKLRANPPPDADALVRRAAAARGLLLDALWALGYFNAEIGIAIAGMDNASEARVSASARGIETFRNKAPVPVVVKVHAGPLFTVRAFKLRIRGDDAQPLIDNPAKRADLEPGAPATSVRLRAAQAKIVDRLRSQSHPLAKVTALRPTVDHALGVMDIEMDVDPGPQAGLGAVSVAGTKDVDPAVVRSFIYLEPGEPYSPKAIADTRKSIAKIAAIGSIRIREDTVLDPDGNLPIFVEVTERAPRLVGLSARYSTIDGPALRTYWEHRNLFGGAERLRLDAEIFLAPRIDGTTIKDFGDFRRSDIGGRLSFHFEKPALAGSRNDLLVDGSAVRERIGNNRYGGYTARYFDGTAAIRHRFSDTFSVQAGVEGETGQTSDVLGQVNYTLLGLPLGVRYDSTDNLLDPTKGVRVIGSLTPYKALEGRSDGFVQTKLAASTYYALDEDARYILAARIGFGSIVGSDLADIPSNHRFYAGGSGSVRGYTYRTLSPLSPSGQLIGGRSLIDGSLEARIKITDTIGIVPFVDAGSAFQSSYPDFNQTIAVAAGIGLRYYTPIGPIRLDVAAPLNPRRGDRPVAVYISIGQSF